MRRSAGILIIIWSLVMVQPAFAYFGGKPAYGECGKDVPASPPCPAKKIAKPGCSKSKCDKTEKEPGEKDHCKNQGCNPSLGCSTGNFYVHHYYKVSITTWLKQKQIRFIADDNRIIKNLSECWHPPELIS